METVHTCPLGSKCEEIKDNKLHRCMWYTQIAGTNPQTGQQVDESKCSLAWMPILLIENARTNQGQTEAICSLREETIKRQDNAMLALRDYDGKNLISK